MFFTKLSGIGVAIKVTVKLDSELLHCKISLKENHFTQEWEMDLQRILIFISWSKQFSCSQAYICYIKFNIELPMEYFLFNTCLCFNSNI